MCVSALPKIFSSSLSALWAQIGCLYCETEMQKRAKAAKVSAIHSLVREQKHRRRDGSMSLTLPTVSCRDTTKPAREQKKQHIQFN